MAQRLSFSSSVSLLFKFSLCFHLHHADIGFSDGDQVRVTQMQYYSYFLQYRLEYFNTLLYAGRLLQEYIVDAYAQIEQSRLQWIRNNQDSLRVEVYQGLADAIVSGADLNQIGTPTILPSTFIGGPRQMWQLYHDAMAIVRACGKPDLFITMTCNPKWPEIMGAIQHCGKSAQDRPDLTARVFQLKLKALLGDLIDNDIFGRVVAHVHVIEFQKRGLPHAHILLILGASDKPTTTDAIDSIVCAEIPDPIMYPKLHETIVSCMLHGPCGLHNSNAPCMKNVPPSLTNIDC
jgi:hypothetical protein